MITVELPEWGKRTVEGRWLRDDEARAEAARLTESGRLEVRELRVGIELSARSYVGEVELGDLRVRIVPKLSEDALQRLLSFAHGARAAAPGEVASAGPAALLGARFLGEVAALLPRGLDDAYQEQRGTLRELRGALDVPALAARGGLIDASLPCRFALRSTDTAPNRALLAGLDLVRRLAPQLGPLLPRLEAPLALAARRAPLDARMLLEARARLGLRTRHYLPALELLEALWRGQAPAPGATPTGFLFDMTRFFQSIVGRLLRGHLRGLDVREEWPMHDVLRYAPDANPLLRRPPTPRPDFALLDRGKIAFLLDAKYRDLWAEPLPRDMLYQLAIYAFGHGRQAVIVYPSDDPYAREARVELREPDGPWGHLVVALRPLPLARLAALSDAPGPAARRELEATARRLVFGDAAGDAP